MAQLNVSTIKWPTQASIERRIKGLEELQARIVGSRPEPFYGAMVPVKHRDGTIGPFRYRKGKAGSPRGQKWTEMRQTVAQLVKESTDLLNLIKQQKGCKNDANVMESTGT